MRELDKEEFDQFRYRLLEDASKNPKLVKHVEEFARIYGRRLHLKKLTRGIIHK
jgi:hypothetical protein